VFPDPDHRPSFVAQGRVRSFVASLVGIELLSPPGGVVLRLGRVLGTPVPEAPVDEDSDPFTRENQIGTGADVLGDPAVDSVAVTKPMEFTPQCHLRRCVADALGLETSTRCAIEGKR
jgi:hypothetical protein